MSAPLLSIVLPVYNQADHISKIVEEYDTALRQIPYPYELVLVVNNSRDNSLEVCHALAQRFPCVCIVHTDKGGWGLAVRLGLEASKGDLLCYTNSARTTSQELQLLSLYAVANPQNVIKANRKIRENWKRRLGSLLYNIECRALFDLAYWDINGTPKFFPRSFDLLLHLRRDDDLIDLEFNIVCRRQGYPVLEVPIFSARRHGGTSTTKYRSALRMYVGAYRMWRAARNGNR